MTRVADVEGTDDLVNTTGSQDRVSVLVPIVRQSFRRESGGRTIG